MTSQLPVPVRLTFVTGNPGKLDEARRLLDGIAEVDQDGDGYTEPQVDTLEEVARAGLQEVAERQDPPFFLEDAGLFVEGLGGFPGVYSAYAFRTLGWQGILDLLAARPDAPRTARFQAVIGYRDPEGRDHLFGGEVHGTIATEGRGDQGFGFDPIFIPDRGDGRTFAELAPHEKGSFSHRGAALDAFVAHLRA